MSEKWYLGDTGDDYTGYDDGYKDGYEECFEDVKPIFEWLHSILTDEQLEQYTEKLNKLKEQK